MTRGPALRGSSVTAFFRSTGVRFPVEFLLLAGMVISLPLFEGAKNVCWILFAGAWYVNRLRDGVSWAALGGRWDAWDTLFALTLAATLLGAYFAGVKHREWTACLDTLRMISVVWFLRRSGYGDSEWLRLHVTIQATVVVACAWSLGALAFPHAYEGIQLHSVGHVNQSVIYIVICFGALVGGVAAYWRTLTTPWRAAAIVALGIELATLFAAGSRAGAATAILGAIAFGLLWMKRSRAPIVWTAIAVGTFVMLLTSFDTDMRRKQEFALDSPHPVLNERYPIWQQALVAWRTHPLFGVGGDNFGDISAARVGAWSAQAGAGYDPATFVRSTHAHSLYLNTLAEHGVLGTLLLLAFCVAWAASIARGKPSITDPPLVWLVWSGAAAALVVTLVLGVFNTTLHDEHGLLAMVMVGMWLGRLRQPTKVRDPVAPEREKVLEPA